MNMKKEIFIYYVKSGLLFSLLLIGLAYPISKLIEKAIPYIITPNLTLLPAILYSIGYILCYLIMAIIAQEMTKKLIKNPKDDKAD